MSVAEWRAGGISAEVALARLVLDGRDLDAVAAELTDEDAPLRDLLLERREALRRMSEMLREAAADHEIRGGDAIARTRAVFDRAVAHSPEASVATYSLGDPAILARATDEIVTWLGARGLLGGDALDLGCGIGRVATALAPHMRSVLGVDVSPAMIAEAERRHGGCPKLCFAVTDGAGIAHLPRCDLIIAVDSFPYLMQAGVGLAEAHVREAASLLRDGGALVILNLAYGSDAGRDRAQIGEWATRYSYRVICDGEMPFRLWDGLAFVLSRAAG
jgi:SAM-dependent methyltransferase